MILLYYFEKENPPIPTTTTTMMSSVTPKEDIVHLLVNVLEFHNNDIIALKDRGGMWNYKKLHATSIDFFEQLYKSEHITLAAFQ